MAVEYPGYGIYKKIKIGEKLDPIVNEQPYFLNEKKNAKNIEASAK